MNQYKNQYGHFNEDGTEYIITDPDTPVPWINVISNGDWGMTISNSGSGFSWYRNAALNRITRWEQDLVHDNSGKWIYLTDQSTGETWSPTLRPAGDRETLRRCVHGLGYSRFVSENNNIRSEYTLTVPHDEAGEVWILKLENKGEKTKELSVSSYFEWALGPGSEENREFQKIFIESEFKENKVSATKRIFPLPGEDEPHNCDYPYRLSFAASEKIISYTNNKKSFLGRNGNYSNPRFLSAEKMQEAGKWGDGICATASSLTLHPGEEKEIIFVLGLENEGTEFLDSQGSEIIRSVRSRWLKYLTKATVHTPADHFDILSNYWLKYQTISGRINGRAAYYQTSGAYGYRDQLQDSLVFLPLTPERTRERIGEHAAHQFEDGTVMHWWHNLSETGPRSDFSDDLLWLPFVTTKYIRETGQPEILDQKYTYLNGKEDTLDGHCRRAIDCSLARQSDRGIPLIGEGDWNDGLSSCGDQWQGESFWLCHFLCKILEEYSRVLRLQGEKSLAETYLEERKKLARAVNEHGWDGEWYQRATLDDGSVIGSRECDEGKIFLNPQTWSLIANTVPPERQTTVINSIKKHLDRKYGPVLFSPAYSKPDPRIGYITRYAPGVRENGGVYTHAACWSIIAAVLAGEPDWAWSLFSKLSPVLRGKEPEIYQAEPYVTPGNIDGPISPFFGRGGWTWYTGSAGWLYRVMNEWLLGIRPDYGGLTVKPAIPDKWDGFKAERIFRGKKYLIEVNRGPSKMRVNETELQPGTPFTGSKEINEVKIQLPREQTN